MDDVFLTPALAARLRLLILVLTSSNLIFFEWRQENKMFGQEIKQYFGSSSAAFLSHALFSFSAEDLWRNVKFSI